MSKQENVEDNIFLLTTLICVQHHSLSIFIVRMMIFFFVFFAIIYNLHVINSKQIDVARSCGRSQSIP